MAAAVLLKANDLEGCWIEIGAALMGLSDWADGARRERGLQRIIENVDEISVEALARMELVIIARLQLRKKKARSAAKRVPEDGRAGENLVGRGRLMVDEPDLSGFLQIN